MPAGATSILAVIRSIAVDGRAAGRWYHSHAVERCCEKRLEEPSFRTYREAESAIHHFNKRPATSAGVAVRTSRRRPMPSHMAWMPFSKRLISARPTYTQSVCTFSASISLIERTDMPCARLAANERQLACDQFGRGHQGSLRSYSARRHLRSRQPHVQRRERQQ